MVFKDFLGNLEMSTSKLPCVTRSVGGYARVTATNLFLIKNQMSSNMMSCTEPVPSGTWQSSVLISVKLLMFQGDVLFLAGICSYQCDIYLTCGHFGLKWHPPRNFVHPPKNCGLIHVFLSQPGGRGMPNPTVITTDLEAAFPTDEKRSCV